MDVERIAKGFAENVKIIAEAAAQIAVGKTLVTPEPDTTNLKAIIDKATGNIAQWLIQPRSGVCAALAKAHRALDGDSNDDEHDALVQLVEAVEQGQ